MEQRMICEKTMFGHLTCLSYLGQYKWRCSCDCGKEVAVDEQMLLSGIITSCGCRKGRCLNLQGQRFGMLTVEKPIQKRDTDHSVRWLCRCDCGNYSIVSSNKLRTGHTTSCGCMRLEAARKKKTFVDGTCLENILSGKLPSNNTSGYRGVSRKRKGWQAYITYAGKTIQLGHYATAQEAAAAREKAFQQLKLHIDSVLAGDSKCVSEHG